MANSVLFELLDENYLLQLKQNCYDQAVRHGGVDTYSAAEHLFEAIESSPATSSRPADYIDAHPIEYRELIYYGDYTLQYVFSKFFLEGNQTGLRGHLMRAVLDDLAPEAQLRLHAETGQAYFDEWRAGAIRISEQHDMDWIKKPACHLSSPPNDWRIIAQRKSVVPICRELRSSYFDCKSRCSSLFEVNTCFAGIYVEICQEIR